MFLQYFRQNNASCQLLNQVTTSPWSAGHPFSCQIEHSAAYQLALSAHSECHNTRQHKSTPQPDSVTVLPSMHDVTVYTLDPSSNCTHAR